MDGVWGGSPALVSSPLVGCSILITSALHYRMILVPTPKLCDNWLRRELRTGSYLLRLPYALSLIKLRSRRGCVRIIRADTVEVGARVTTSLINASRGMQALQRDIM